MLHCAHHPAAQSGCARGYTGKCDLGMWAMEPGNDSGGGVGGGKQTESEEKEVQDVPWCWH